MKLKLYVCIIAFIACTSFLNAQEQAQQLAEVLVLPFRNESGQKEYAWLSHNIPNAIVDSMQEKFQFNLITRDQFEEIVALSKSKETVLYQAVTDETQIKKISTAVNADIIIYGKYTYSKAKKIVIVKAFIYHRSRMATTGNIDMDTPVTSEMFKIVDKVADSVVTHIALIAKEDAEAAKKARETIAIAEKALPKQEEKIVLVKPEAQIGKSYQIILGGAIAGFIGNFNEIFSPGPALTIGITNSEHSFWHWGASASFIYISANKESNYNMIDYMLFSPLCIHGGINIHTSFFPIIQPFAGFGLSIDMMKVGEEMIFFERQPLRKGNTTTWYLDPVALVGIRVPISVWGLYIAPFAQMYVYFGKDESGSVITAQLLLLGAQVYF